nr:VCBS repeat-containing protein [Diaminobutyricibacter tongyongensis]
MTYTNGTPGRPKLTGGYSGIIPTISGIASGSIGPGARCDVDVRSLQVVAIVAKKYGSVQLNDLNRNCAGDPGATCDGRTIDISPVHCVERLSPPQGIDFGTIGGLGSPSPAYSKALLSFLSGVIPAGSRAEKNCEDGSFSNFERFSATGCHHQHVDFLRSGGAKLNIPTSSSSAGTDLCPSTPGFSLFSGCPLPRSANSTDFNHDRRADVFFANPNGQWWVSDSGNSKWRISASTGVPIDYLQFADFNGDGTDDVFWPNPNGQWWVSYGGNTKWQILASAGVPGEQLQLGDFNGDGKADVFYAHPNGHWWVSYGGNSKWAITATAVVPAGKLRIADFNGDGKDDVFWANPNGQWWVSYGGNSKWQVMASAGVPVEQLRFGDFNGDGKADVLWTNPNGQWWVSYGGNTKWIITATAGVPGEQLQVADLNGDGKADVFWANPNGQWWVSYGGNSQWVITAAAGVPSSQLATR